TILFLLFPREKRGFAMGLAGMVINVAPAVGPPISGVLIQYFEWRALFYLTLPIAGIILVMIYFFSHIVTHWHKSAIDHLSFNVAPAVVPPFSGLLIQYFEWRALFYLTLPIAGIILVMIYFFMHNVTQRQKSAIDFLSIILSTIGFGGLLYGFNQLQETGLT